MAVYGQPFRKGLAEIASQGAVDLVRFRAADGAGQAHVPSLLIIDDGDGHAGPSALDTQASIGRTRRRGRSAVPVTIDPDQARVAGAEQVSLVALSE